jgi:hypothetical protein
MERFTSAAFSFEVTDTPAAARSAYRTSQLTSDVSRWPTRPERTGSTWPGTTGAQPWPGTWPAVIRGA